MRSVRIGIVPTGNDLVPLGVAPAPGQTIETNTLMAETYLTRMGATCRRYGIVPDDPAMIRSMLEKAVAENDFVILILSAGSSAGSRDYSPDVIGTLGEIIFHGIAVRPGKPVLLARVDGKPVLGMPGYPVAAQTVLREIVGDMLCWWGLAPEGGEELGVRLSRKLASDVGFDEFIPVSVGRIGGVSWATPHPRGVASRWRWSGRTATSISRPGARGSGRAKRCVSGSPSRRGGSPARSSAPACALSP
ncbi:MAG: molybdopterin-binding protein [Methanoculleus sp.]